MPWLSSLSYYMIYQYMRHPYMWHAKWPLPSISTCLEETRCGACRWVASVLFSSNFEMFGWWFMADEWLIMASTIGRILINGCQWFQPLVILGNLITQSNYILTIGQNNASIPQEFKHWSMVKWFNTGSVATLLIYSVICWFPSCSTFVRV